MTSSADQLGQYFVHIKNVKNEKYRMVQYCTAH
jgi:hypothetical protein